MRRPRSSEAFKEYSYVLNFKNSEKIIRKLEGNLGRVALIFPNSYSIASGSLAWSWIQTLLMQRGLHVQRFFYERWFEKFYSMEDQVPLDEFPIWLFTFQFENDLLNIAEMLLKKGIPLSIYERKPYHPIVIIGGPVTLFNNELIDEIADFVFIGDLECNADEFAKALGHDDKDEIVKHLLDIKQIYSKRYGKLVFSNCIGTLSPVPVAHFITPYSPYKNKLLVELGRGCIRRCAFCVTGYTKKPVKFASLDEVIEVFERYQDFEFGLISATITDYPYLERLLEYLERKNVRFSVSSMRADKINEKLLRLLKTTEHHSFTIAPEGISQKLRDVMLKDLTTEELITALELGRKVGFKQVKFYYIIGLEEEDGKDYAEFFEFLKTVINMRYQEISISINPLVPKPFTPFESRKMIDKKSYEERVAFIRKNIPKKVKADFESYKLSKMQYEISHLKGTQTIEYLREVFKNKK
ncbi:B12-binding domain-containing radical SAM protein [Fervidobacterium islandicum]|uniref:B12-binding domain-containing radical SAM protein n=1 Tax=Fervidobacterium islandicum TaxID=2423 RepID=A0AAI8GCN8_FERIS|nr:radical SAM protein [Fervidobacterium islandicum]AMW32246.1 B12-binding domain-containing radical SAM protein [Fervidobacterium islandicum]